MRRARLRLGTLPLAIAVLIVSTWYVYVFWIPKAPPKPDAVWTRILAEGVFRVGIDPSFPPFESDDGNGNLSGLDIDLVNEITREWSAENGTPIRVEYVYTGFDGLYDALLTGQFDAILSALPYDPRRTQDVRYTHAYFDAGPLIVLPEHDSGTTSWYDLAGKRIGVELGSSGDIFARRWQRRLKYDLREYHAPGDALRAVEVGEVDVAFVDTLAYNEFLRTGAKLKLVGEPLIKELIVMAVRKDTPTLLNQINTVIASMKADGRMQRLYGLAR